MSDNSSNTDYRNYWDGVPDELMYMCLAVMRECNDCVQPILKYLTDRMNDCEYSMSGVSAEDYLTWIDRAMEAALYPAEFHADDWRENAECISRLLDRFEQLLQRCAPRDYISGHRTEFDIQHRVNYIELAQHLDVYCCTALMFSENWKKMEERLGLLLADTKRNVSYLLSNNIADVLAENDDWMDKHYVITDIWEPLEWFCSSVSSTEALKICIPALEEYAMFLQASTAKTCQKEMCMKLRYKAEMQLRTLCELMMEAIEDELEFGEENGFQGQASERTTDYLELICESKQRETKAITEGESYQCHKEHAAFTQKLRNLMAEYPTMPVVVSQHESFDCNIGYIYDPKTGAFREKVIAIYTEGGEPKHSNCCIMPDKTS